MMPRKSFLLRLLLPLCALSPVVGAQGVNLTLTAAPGVAQFGNGQIGNAWLYNGQFPGPVIRVTQGQPVRVKFINALPEDSTIHWHGIPLAVGMDGTPGLSRPSVAPGQEFVYDFTPTTPGTFFYHPHVGTQIQNGLKAAFIVDPAAGGDPAFDVEQTILLDQWFDPLPGQSPSFSGHLINGKNSAGQTATTVQAGQNLRLRFINGSATTQYVVAIDGHNMTVTHADGARVQPVVVQALPIGVGERYDVIVNCGNPGVWSIAASNILNRNATLVRAVLAYAGSAAGTPAANFVPANLSSGTLLSYNQLVSDVPVPPIVATPTHQYTETLAFNPGTSLWTINGEAWPNVTPMLTSLGDTVRFHVVNTTNQFHPMHLHCHSFRLLGTAGGTTSAAARDTILIGPQGSATGTMDIEMLSDNPGAWLFHCHHLGHQNSAMMALLQYTGDQDQDGISDGFDFDPVLGHPVLTLPTTASSFHPGSTIALDAQWTPGQMVAFFMGVDLVPPADLGPIGVLSIWPVFELGTAVVGGNFIATLNGAVPNDPALIGAHITLQALGFNPALAPGYRLSPPQVVAIN